MDSPNPVAKSASAVGGMLAGADRIDDLDLLRHGGMPRLFGGVRAPSTLGTFLRSFTHGHVQQLDSVGARVLAGLAARVPGLLAGAGADGIAFIDVDDTVRQVHGYAKQGAAYGYSAVRGLNIALATISTPTAAPVIALARLRKGNTASATGAWRLLAQAITTARAAKVSGQVLARADSAYYGWAFVGTRDPSPRLVLGDRPDDQDRDRGDHRHRPGRAAGHQYPEAVFDEDEQRWISDAEVAEVPFVAFTGRRKAEHVACRLIVRRVKRLQPRMSNGTEQGELFSTYRHHAFITNSSLPLTEADERHRDHALIEQVIAELKDGPLALPSGKCTANAAWVAHAAIAFNLAPRHRRRSRRTQGPLGNATHPDHQHPRPDRDHRPTPRAAPTHQLALDTGLGITVVDRDRDGTANAGSNLTTQRRVGATQDPMWKSRCRPAAPSRPTTTKISDPANQHLRNQRWWIRAQWATLAMVVCGLIVSGKTVIGT